jgi:subtilisin family serine protease
MRRLNHSFKAAMTALVLFISVMPTLAQDARLRSSVQSINFGNVWISYRDTVAFDLINSGNVATTVNSIVSSTSVFTSFPAAPLIVPAGGMLTVRAVYAPLTSGQRSGSLTINSNAGDNPVITITLTGAGATAPLAALTPSSLLFRVNPSTGPSTLQAVLRNNGGDTLRYRVSSIDERVNGIVITSTVQNPLPAINASLIYSNENLNKPFANGRVIVGMNNGFTSATITATQFANVAIKSVRELGKAKNPKTGLQINNDRRVFLLNLQDESREGVLNAINAIRRDPAVAYVEPDYILKALAVPNDPSFSQLYGMLNSGQLSGTPDADIDATDVWDKRTVARNIIVGVIDTGIDYDHPDLAANMWTNPGEIAGNNIDDDRNGYIDDIHGWDFAYNDNNPTDGHYHGTHCAGTIAAVGNNGIGVAGVCWGAQLMALKFLDDGGSGNTSDAIDAVNYATAMGVHITSNSWGGGGFSQALMDAIGRGGLFVAAAGNSSDDNDSYPHYPSSYTLDNIIAVAATDRNDLMAYFSCYGRTSVDLGAPGVDIYSCAPGNSYRFLSGTSMATPHVSGAAALVWSKNASMTPLQVKNLLLQNTDPVSSLANRTVTGGRLNVDKAYTAASPQWLTVAPESPGMLLPGASVTFNVTVNPAGLTAGTHNADVNFATNDPSRQNLVLNVSAEVAGCRSLVSSVSSVTFPDIVAGQSDTMELELTNSCNDVVTISSITSSDPDFVVLISSPIAVPANGTQRVAIQFDPEAVRTYNGQLTIQSNATDNPVIRIALSGAARQGAQISVSPGSIRRTINAGGTATADMIIRNSGDLALNYSLETEAISSSSVSIPENIYGSEHFVTIAKGAKDTRIGNVVPDGNGGPDLFGYRWVDSDEPNGPAYSWTDISVTGTRLTAISGCDDCYQSQSLSFSFPFYGTSYTSMYVSSNGYITFGTASSQFSNYPLPSTSMPANLVAPFFDDLYPSGTGGIYFQDFGDRAIVQFTNIAPFSGTGAYTFQIVLTRNGEIKFYYNSITGSVSSATAGIQNATRNDGFAIAYNTTYIKNNLAVRISTQPPWLRVGTTSGTVTPGNSATVPVLFDGTSATLAGTMAGRVIVSHNIPGTNAINVPCTLTILGYSRLEATPVYLDYGNLWVGARDTISLTLRNAGNEATRVNSLVINNTEFTHSAVLPLTVPPFSSVNVNMVFAPQSTGQKNAVITIQSDADDNPVLIVNASGIGTTAPVASISPANLTFNMAPTDAPSTLTATLSNTGGDVLSYQLGTIDETSGSALVNVNKVHSVKTDIIYSRENLNKPFINGRVIVAMTSDFKETSLTADQFANVAIKSVRELGVAKNPKSGMKINHTRRVFLVYLTDDTQSGVLNAIDAIRQDPSVAYVEPDYELKALAIPNDASFSQLYGMYNSGQSGGSVDSDIDATDVWDKRTVADNIIIGIIDTGIDYVHPDLAANMWTNPGEIPGNNIDDDNNGFVDDVYGWDFANDDNNPTDGHFHGTHCAGTVAAVGNNGIGVAGVCWSAKLMALKFLTDGGSGSTSDAIDAVNYATAMGVHITSNSWGGGGFSQALNDEIALGGLFVAAAGNSGSDNDVSPHYPASYTLDNVVSVAATDRNDGMASFSCYGRTSVDLGAPGVDIYSCQPGNSYQLLSGTSMATPHVSGAAALVWAKNPSMTPVQVKELLLENTDPVSSLANRTVSGGRLNVNKAYDAAGPQWLTVAPTTAGQLQPGESVVFSFTVNPAGMLGGAHTADVTFTTNSPVNQNPVVHVTANISGCRSLIASSQTISFPRIIAGQSETMSIQLANRCNAPVTITTISIPDPAFRIMQNLPLIVPPNGSQTVSVIFNPAVAGTYNGTLIIESDAEDNPAIAIALTGNAAIGSQISVTPSSISRRALPGDSVTSDIVITNRGDMPLDFTVTTNATTSVSVPLAETVYGSEHFKALSKGENDTRVGNPVVLGRGGPDNFGYRWIDSDEPNGPAYSWTDISSTGRRLTTISGCDDCNQSQSLSFSFPFYGTSYNSMHVSSNGYITFGTASSQFSNYPLPSASMPANLVAPFFDDLYPSGTGGIYFQDFGDRAIVQFTNIAPYSGSGAYTFQIVLNRNGEIDFYYNSIIGSVSSATAGIQNGTRNDGFAIAYNTTYIKNNLAVKISTQPAWLSVATTSGSIAPGASAIVQVRLNAASLSAGTYTGDITLGHNVVNTLPINVPVNFVVSDQNAATSSKVLSIGTSTLQRASGTSYSIRDLRIGSVVSGRASGTQYRVRVW